MKTFLTTTTAASALLIGLLPAHAENAILLDTITATANLSDTDVSRTGNTVEIVTEDELEDAPVSRLSDVLTQVPGVNVVTNGPLGGWSGLTIRGASQYYVGVRLDGIDITDPSAPKVAYDFGTLSTGDLSRIEVLKGSQSALYGANAVGGVIDMTSRRATEDGLHHSVDLEYGSYNTLRGSYGLTMRNDMSELDLTISRVQTDGFSAADENDGNTEADGFTANRLSFYGHVDTDGGVRLGLSGFVDQSRGEFDPQYYADPSRTYPIMIGDGESYDEVTDANSAGLRAFVEFSTGAVDHSVSASIYDVSRRYRSSETYLLYDQSYSVIGSYLGVDDYTYAGTRRQLRYQGDAMLNADMRLSFGADATFEDYDQFGSYGTLAADSRDLGAFAEWAYAPNAQLDIALSLRHDDHATFGGFTTGRLSAAYRPREDLILRAAAGTGFRAPSLFELYSGFGDPTLEPETSLSAELGIEKRFANDTGFVRATAFYLAAENLIGYDYGSTACAYGPGCYNQVPGVARRTGVELETGFDLGPALSVGGSYTYIDSSVSATWADVARHDVSLFANYAFNDRLTGGLTLEHVADRPNSLGDYTVAHASVSYAFDDSTEAYLRIENLFDTEYQQVQGYGTSDRAFYLGLRKNF
ncbi:TonB-dependent receptor plug domain-containing protein [Actibacterium sp.]|uniref:TonB-dependent receptor plug domain-containing protein n=1 Tax=Actibacterium sp. TaxID=1872125 RepID=UPI003568A90C